MPEPITDGGWLRLALNCVLVTLFSASTIEMRKRSLLEGLHAGPNWRDRVVSTSCFGRLVLRPNVIRLDFNRHSPCCDRRPDSGLLGWASCSHLALAYSETTKTTKW